MKRFFIFLLSLLIAGSAFADGYGKIKWKFYSRSEILNFNSLENWLGLTNSEDDDIDDYEFLILYYEALKIYNETKVYIYFDKDSENNVYNPKAVMYFLNNFNDKDINKIFSQYELLGRDIGTLEVKKQSEIENNLTSFIRMIADDCLYIGQSNFVDKQISKEQNKPTVTVYRYNEDTIAIVYQNCIEGQTLVVYTYHEPDY